MLTRTGEEAGEDDDGHLRAQRVAEGEDEDRHESRVGDVAQGDDDGHDDLPPEGTARNRTARPIPTTLARTKPRAAALRVAIRCTVMNARSAAGRHARRHHPAQRPLPWLS